MEMDRPPACKCTWAEDGKQEIYLEWPKAKILCQSINLWLIRAFGDHVM